MKIILTSALLRQLAEDTNFWNRPEVLIFGITAVVYFYGFLIYGGYISGFTGSIGNNPFTFSDLTLIDLLSIFPISVITILRFLLTEFFKALKAFFWYFFIPISLGVVIQSGFNLSIPSNLLRGLSITAWLGIMLWVMWRNVKISFSCEFVFCFLVALLAGIGTIFSYSTTGKTVNFTLPPDYEQIITTLVWISISFIFIPLVAFVFGMEISDAVVKGKALSQVSRLVLQQPISTLDSLPQTAKSENMSKHGRFTKPSVLSSREPDSFTYDFSNSSPLFLVSVFRNFSLFFFSEEIPENPMNGRVVSISSQKILSIEFIRNPKEETNKKSSPTKTTGRQKVKLIFAKISMCLAILLGGASLFIFFVWFSHLLFPAFKFLGLEDSSSVLLPFSLIGFIIFALLACFLKEKT